METLQSSGLVWGMNPALAAVLIVTVAYFIIFTEKVNRAVIALLGAAAMLISGILTQTQALSGIDFNTLALLIGMMIIVAITERSGLFQFVAVWGAKRYRQVHAVCWPCWLSSRRCFPGFWIM